MPDFFSTPAAPAASGLSNGAAAKPAAAAATPTPLSGSNITRLPRVMVDEEAFALLQKLAEQEGKTLTQMASDAIKNYKK